MKKAGLWMALLLVLLTGCSSKTPKIDAYSWVMTSMQSMDAGGQAVAYGEKGSSTLEGAKQIELVCEAQGAISPLPTGPMTAPIQGRTSKVKGIPNPQFMR